MITQWKFSKDDLGAFLRFFSKPKFEGIECNMIEDNLFLEVCQQWKNSSILILQDNGYRLEEGTQLAIITMLDCEAYFFCKVKRGELTETLRIYMHGETIILVEQDMEGKEYNVYWLPVLQFAIGALNGMFKFLPITQDKIIITNVNDIIKNRTEDFEVKMIGNGKRVEEFSAVLYKTEHAFIWTKENEEATGKIVSKKDVLHDIIDWIALAYKESLKGVIAL